MTEQRFIRPTDRLPVEDYPEWLQADAAQHRASSSRKAVGGYERRKSWREHARRALTGLAVLAIAGALIASAQAWQDFVTPKPAAFGGIEDEPTPLGQPGTPVAP